MHYGNAHWVHSCCKVSAHMWVITDDKKDNPLRSPARITKCDSSKINHWLSVINSQNWLFPYCGTSQEILPVNMASIRAEPGTSREPHWMCWPTWGEKKKRDGTWWTDHRSSIKKGWFLVGGERWRDTMGRRGGGGGLDVWDAKGLVWLVHYSGQQGQVDSSPNIMWKTFCTTKPKGKLWPFITEQFLKTTDTLVELLFLHLTCTLMATASETCRHQ